MDFVELRTLGFNTQTLAFLGTLVFTLVSFQARLLQYRTIRHKHSGESVATCSHIFSTFFFAVALAYGIATERLALIINGVVLVVGCVAVVCELWRVKGFGRVDWVTVAVGCVGLWALLTAGSPTARNLIYGLILAAGTVWGLGVPYELWKNKKQGAFRIEGSFVAVVSISFWTVYAFATKDTTLMVMCPVQLISVALTIVLWLCYGGDPKKLFRKQAA